MNSRLSIPSLDGRLPRGATMETMVTNTPTALGLPTVKHFGQGTQSDAKFV